MRKKLEKYNSPHSLPAIIFVVYYLYMKIDIVAKNLDLTPSLKTYIESKLAAVSRLIKRLDAEGVAIVRVELARVTHHKHGDVFWAAADLRLPKKVLRAEAELDDVRAAIDAVKDILHIEIEKYKTRFIEPRRASQK